MNDDYRMPLGEHKGKPLKDVPVSYLDWLIGQDWLFDAVKKKITDHLENSRKAEWDALSE